MIDISILNLANYPQGKTITDAFHTTLDLAKHAEEWGYKRYWLAEHHNLEGIASAATAVLIGYVAGGTQTIRVGSGGIMLPNHAPLVIAEQFGTLETLYPGRIDLGLGRAPGTDQLTMRALRGGGINADEFPEQIEELLFYFSKAEPGQKIKAIPGAGLQIPIWILGSSLFSARLAARLGRPYAFAGHFAPQMLQEALGIYRAEFRPSDVLDKPRVMVGVQIVAADTDAKAEYLATSVYQTFLSLIRGTLRQTPPPVADMNKIWQPHEEGAVQSMMKNMVVGSPETVTRKLQELLAKTRADELIFTTGVYDYADRLRSFEIVSQIKDQL
jgi:luciferase family oxidoreductase group 1